MPSIGAAKQALLLAQIMHTAAYSALNVARPLRPVQLPSLRPRQLHAIDATATRSSHKVVLRAAADAGDDAVDAVALPVAQVLAEPHLPAGARPRPQPQPQPHPEPEAEPHPERR